jgi:hypothetical protein
VMEIPTRAVEPAGAFCQVQRVTFHSHDPTVPYCDSFSRPGLIPAVLSLA